MSKPTTINTGYFQEMENEIPVIVISDEDEEEASSRAAESSVIVIPDDDVIDGFADSPACQPLENKNSLRDQNGGVDTPFTSFTSPQLICCNQAKKCSLDVTRFRLLKARVKIPKQDPNVLKRLVSSPEELDDGENSHSVTPNHRVKIEDDVNHNHSSEKLGQEQDMSLFDSCQRKFFGSHKKGRDSPIRNNTPYKTTSKTKPSECTTSPLKQSTLNRVNFSPKGRRPGDLRLKQEQSTPYITPLYCAVPLRYSECAASVSYTFTENQMNSLQALKEEQFYKLILDTVVTFISQCRKPPASLVFYLFHNILLFGNSNLGPQCLRVLQEIQVLHPAVPAEMLRQKITWEYLSMVVDLSQCTQKSKSNSSHASSAFNSFMALTFLVIVMEGEVQRKTFSLVKTSAYRLLHAFKQSSHIHDIVFWIGRSVQQHPNVSSSCGYSCCPVFILQRFLHLSLLVSELPGESATRIADDLVLVYLKLQYLHHKTLFLQSFQSHLLRTKLIVVVISNICSSYTNQENRGYFCGGIRSFVTCMFQFSPPTNSSLSQDCSSVKPAKRGVCVDSCEEFIMLIAYWIQSYLFTRSRTLQKNTSDDMPKLSLDDVDVLMKLDEPVASFKMHLESLCSPLSTRSYQLLDLISSLKSCSAVKELSDFCA